jgi:hypothetical protein
LSIPQESTNRSSGEYAAELTKASCPVKVRISLPITTSHNLTALSPAERACFPSAEKATDCTPECPNWTNISGLWIPLVGEGLSAAFTKTEKTDNIANIPNQIADRCNKFLSVIILTPVV